MQLYSSKHITGVAKSACLIILFFLLFGCANINLYDGSHKGKIIDATTKEPIEGAVVAGIWYERHLSGVEGYSTYYDNIEVLTDKNGEFSIPGKGLNLPLKVTEMSFLIFKTGYKEFGPDQWSSLKKILVYRKNVSWENDKVIIPISKLTLEERKKRGRPSRFSAAPMFKQKFLTNEINTDRVQLGMDPLIIGDGNRNH